MCLLSDQALGASTWDSASINEEDVFYDSRSGDSDDESDDEGLVFYDASPDRAASEDGSCELDEAPTPAVSNADDSHVPIITLTLSEEEDLLDLFTRPTSRPPETPRRPRPRVSLVRQHHAQARVPLGHSYVLRQRGRHDRHFPVLLPSS